MGCKVLFVLPNLQGGGAERVVLNVARYLAARRFDVTVFTIKKEGVYWAEVPKGVRIASGMQKGRLWWRLPMVLFRLIREARRHQVVVGAMELTPTYAAWLAGKVTGRQVVGWIHTSMPDYLSLCSVFHRVIARFVYSRVKYLVCVSDGCRSAMERWAGRREEQRCQVIYNAFDQGAYAFPDGASVDWLVSDVPVVLSVGRLISHKGYDVLIQSHADLMRKGLRHKLVILGEGAERDRLRAVASSLHVADSVIMPGFIPRVLDAMRLSTVFVLASRFEGFGMVLVEALSVGLPVISTDCPVGPSEVLKRGEYGMLVPPEDPAELANAIERMLTDERLRAHFKSVGPKRAADFSPICVLPKWEKLLEDLAA